MSWSDVPLMTNTDELRSLVHARWQERVVDAFRVRGWRPARHDASGGPVPWEEVASTAVEAIWRDMEAIVSPIVELLAGLPVVDVPREPQQPAHPSPDALWMSADVDPGDGYLELWVIDTEVEHLVSLGPVRDDGVYDLPRSLDPAAFPIVDVSVEPLDGNPAHSTVSVLRGELDL